MNDSGSRAGEHGAADNLERDLILAAFNAARAEILLRVQHREFIVRSYLIGTVSFLGVAVSDLAGSVNQAVLCSVMPLFSLAVASHFYYNAKTINGLANFIRRDIEGRLRTDFGMEFYHYDRKNMEKAYNADRTKYSYWASILSIHLPSLISVSFAWAGSEVRDDYLFSLWATVVAVMALVVTLKAKSHRKKYNQN